MNALLGILVVLIGAALLVFAGVDDRASVSLLTAGDLPTFWR